MPIWNEALGLIGKADVVEYTGGGEPYPVEYKQGSRHKAPAIAACDDVQLAAQAMCLEAMGGHAVSEGAIYYASSKRRRVVSITADLRQQVVAAAHAVRGMLVSGRLPPPLEGTEAVQHCRACSLHDRCQPEATAPILAHMRASLFTPEEA